VDSRSDEGSSGCRNVNKNINKKGVIWYNLYQPRLRTHAGPLHVYMQPRSAIIRALLPMRRESSVWCPSPGALPTNYPDPEYWSHDFNWPFRPGSRDVIGHVTIGFAIPLTPNRTMKSNGKWIRCSVADCWDIRLYPFEDAYSFGHHPPASGRRRTPPMSPERTQNLRENAVGLIFHYRPDA